MFKNSLLYPEKDISNCGLAGFINKDKKRVDGSIITKIIANQHDRGNGLGGGFAVYGLYPEYEDKYVFHLMYEHQKAKEETESFLNKFFRVIKSEEIPTRQIEEIKNSPLHYRYFVELSDEKKPASLSLLSEEDYVVNRTIEINKNIDGAFVVSSGKNFAAFKGVGFPEDISKFFMLENYKGYAWTAHNRFPTNTPGWWGGAHPFTLLDFSIVHNGELSSYGINKRYVEMFGYECTMLTDSEVVAYLVDLLVRKHRLPFKVVCDIFSPPTWDYINNIEDKEIKEYHKKLRIVYGSALLNGPFGFIIGFNGGLVGLSDRIKLRPLVVVESGNTTYLSSEESSVLEVCNKIDSVWHPKAGEPVFAFYNDYKGE